MYSIFSFAFVVRIVVDDICQFYRWCSQILNMRANPPVHASPGRCRRLDFRRATMCQLLAMAMASVDHKRYDFGDSNGARETWNCGGVG